MWVGRGPLHQSAAGWRSRWTPAPLQWQTRRPGQGDRCLGNQQGAPITSGGKSQCRSSVRLPGGLQPSRSREKGSPKRPATGPPPYPAPFRLRILEPGRSFAADLRRGVGHGPPGSESGPFHRTGEVTRGGHLRLLGWHHLSCPLVKSCRSMVFIAPGPCLRRLAWYRTEDTLFSGLSCPHCLRAPNHTALLGGGRRGRTWRPPTPLTLKNLCVDSSCPPDRDRGLSRMALLPTIPAPLRAA